MNDGLIAVISDSRQHHWMKYRYALGLILVPLSAGCTGTATDGREKCTLDAVGEEMGADSLRVTLQVPESFLTGAEIANGGISTFNDDCDFPLNSFFSDETARYVIKNAPRGTLSHHDRFFRVVDATLSIWKFSDGLGKMGFFVTGVSEMRPIPKARTSQEARYYAEPPHD